MHLHRVSTSSDYKYVANILIIGLVTFSFLNNMHVVCWREKSHITVKLLHSLYTTCTFSVNTFRFVHLVKKFYSVFQLMALLDLKLKLR